MPSPSAESPLLPRLPRHSSWIPAGRAVLARSLLAGGLGVATLLHGASAPPPTYLTIKVGYDGTAESQDRPEVKSSLEFRDQLGGTTEVRPTSEGGVVKWYPRRDGLQMEGSNAQHSRTEFAAG